MRCLELTPGALSGVPSQFRRDEWSVGKQIAKASVVYLAGGALGTQALFVELLLSGFFAVACFRARATALESIRIAPRTLFALTDRLERLRRSRWQWFSIGLVLILVRLQRGTPMVAELTALAQFIVFLALPTQSASREVVRER
jgi:hypothetical protein